MSRLKSPFAFLGRSAAAEDDDKDDKNKSKSKAEEKDDEDDDKKDKKDDDAKSKSKSKAEDSDDEDDKKKDDEDDDKARSKKAKSKASDDDDDDDKGTDAKAARARERGRIRAILTSPAGQADPVAAAHVALDTGMPRADAIAMLSAMQLSRDAMGGGASAVGRDRLSTRMEGVPNAEVGADGGRGGRPTMADRIIAAGKKARGEA